MNTVTFSLETLMQSPFYHFCDKFAAEDLALSVQIGDEIALIVESSEAYTVVYPDHLHPYCDDFSKNMLKLSDVVNRYKNRRGMLRKFEAQDMRNFTDLRIEFLDGTDQLILSVDRC